MKLLLENVQREENMEVLSRQHPLQVTRQSSTKCGNPSLAYLLENFWL